MDAVVESRSGEGTREPVVMAVQEWSAAVTAHEARADELTAGHRARRGTGRRHAIEDFLYDYYGTRPSRLRRWHPGPGRLLAPAGQGPAPHAQWRWYRTDADGCVGLDVEGFLRERADVVRATRDLLVAITARPAFTGCFGLHEWAMVYRQEVHRHPLPLRLGQAGTDALVEASGVRCSHFDAFRFFTPEAEPLNHVRPTRATQIELDQPGCLHVAMDCHKYATRLAPAVPGELALDCFALAARARVLDMQASPYDCSSYGLEPVPIETPAGRKEYVARQAALAEQAQPLRAALVEVCEALLAQR